MATDTPIDVMMLDAEFTNYLKLARELMKKMRLAEDRRVCDKYIRKCFNMKNSDQLRVKLHRNRFFRYLLKTMQRTVDTQAVYFLNIDGIDESENQDFTQWSADKKSYVSAKVIPGYGTMIYMACTDNPELGWDYNGFVSFENIQEVPFVNFSDQPRAEEQQRPPTPPAQRFSAGGTPIP